MIIIYIGDGKGKTTAAVGLAVRAAGSGKKVLFTQFVKAAAAKESGEWPLSSEIGILKKTKNITVKVLGRGFVGILGDRKAKSVHAAAAKTGLNWLTREIKSGKYDVVIADELISAIEAKLLTVSQILKFVKVGKSKLDALVRTGYKKSPPLLKAADLVT